MLEGELDEEVVVERSSEVVAEDRPGGQQLEDEHAADREDREHNEQRPVAGGDAAIDVDAVVVALHVTLVAQPTVGGPS